MPFPDFLKDAPRDPSNPKFEDLGYAEWKKYPPFAKYDYLRLRAALIANGVIKEKPGRTEWLEDQPVTWFVGKAAQISEG